jgi:hypothetical protein
MAAPKLDTLRDEYNELLKTITSIACAPWRGVTQPRVKRFPNKYCKEKVVHI